MTKTDLRELALNILLEVTEQKEFCHLVLKSVLDKYQYLQKQERAFLTRLVQGTLERMLELDYVIDWFSKVKVQKMKPVIRGLLRMSVYQLKYMDSVPDAAVCNEAVKLARKKGFAGLSGFVNGVLRSIARGYRDVKYPDQEKQTAEYLSVLYSMPMWLTEKWMAEYGRTTTEEMLGAFLEKTDTTIRVHRDKIAPEELRRELEVEGIEAAPVEGVPFALRIRHYDTLNRIKAFQQGLFSVQDVGSMLCVEAADPGMDDFCLDVCAAPGGKSLYMAEKMAGTGMVEARDLTDYKIRFIEENIKRSGRENIRCKIFDARQLDETMVEQADVVLADLPCSGLGVLGQKPDIKYRMNQKALEELSHLQREILGVVWQYVKPGGTLVYSTCTVNRQENEENAKWFLSEFPFEEAPLPGVFKGFADQMQPECGMCQLLPGPCGNDGFFVAKFRRKYREEKDGKI